MFETGQTFQPTTRNITFVQWSPKRSATMLDPFAQLFHAHYAWFTKTYGLYPSHDSLQVSTLLGVVAYVRRPLPTRKQQLSTLLVQQCWKLLSPFARSLRVAGWWQHTPPTSFESRRRRHMWDVGSRSWSCAKWFFSWYSGTTFVVKIHSNFSSIWQCRQRAILLMCYHYINI